MAQARGSTSAHLSFETVRFPGRSFMPRSLLSALLRESEGSLVRDRPRGRVCEFGCVFVCVLLGGGGGKIAGGVEGRERRRTIVERKL